MKEKKRIWLVSEVFYPDTDIASGNISTEIASKLVQKYEVHVICGPADYERKNQGGNATPLDVNIVVHRWRYFALSKNNPLKRLIRAIGLSLAFLFMGLKIRKSDTVLVISNPAFITPIYAFLRLIIKFQYILLMHDVFPENLVAAKYINEQNLTYKLTQSLFSKSRKAADKIIVIGRDMKDLLLRKFPMRRQQDIVIIPNWADVNEIYPTESKNEIIGNLRLQGKVIMLFAGNHGVLQNLQAFFRIIQRVSNPNLHFIFAGGGSERSLVEEYAKSNKLSNVSFLPSFPRKDVNNILNACDIGLVSLKDEVYGVGVPSKSYNILAAGKPVCFIGNTDTEIAKFVKENNIGWAFRYDEPSEIENYLNSLSNESLEDIRQKGKQGREIVVRKYSKQIILNTILESLEMENEDLLIPSFEGRKT